MPKAMKDVLWAIVKEKFAYPKGTKNVGGTFVVGLCGRALRN
jgi:hypothetical protein